MEKNNKMAIGITCALLIMIMGTLYALNRPKEVIISDEPSLAEEEVEVYEEEREKIMVYVAGCVKNPGVYEVESGARVKDALELAGGATDEAELRAINLAARIKDEDKIIVPGISDDVDIFNEQGDNESGLININTATVEELKTLPGVGDVIAGNIVSYREKNGKFASIEDIKDVPMIGAGRFAQIADFITV